METADAERRNAKLPDNRLSGCSEKSYAQEFPPVRFFDLGGHKSTENDVLKDSAGITSYNPLPELAHNDKIPEAKSRNNVVASRRHVAFLNSAEQSSIIFKDFDTAEYISILESPAECVVSSCVIQDQKKAASASISCSLMNFLSGDQLKNAPTLDVEKGPMEIDADYDDVDDRPLVLDLGDTANASPCEPPTSPAVIFSEDGSTVFRRPLPPSKASLKAAPKNSLSGPPSTTLISPPPRVQKPIRPFVPQHFNSLECNSVCNSPTTMPAHHLPAPPFGASTIRLQTLSPQLTPSVPSVVGPQQTNGVQFMSILTPPHSVSTAVSASAVHLFNLAPMPGFLNAAPSVFFQSIPSAGGGHSVPSGSIQFAPPPLFAPQAFPPPPPSHFARVPSNLTFANSHAPHTVSSLPPPPPLAPAPTLTSMQQHAGATRPQLTGLFIPDMSAWTIPTLQPVFSNQHASITATTVSSGEVLYSTVLTPSAPAIADPAIVVSTSSPSVTSLPSATSSLALTTSSKPDIGTVTTVNGGTMTPVGNFTISARRWRPSFGRKNGAPVGTCPSTRSVDEIPTTVPSSYTTTLTTAVSTPFSMDTSTSPSVSSSVTVAEELPSKAKNSNHVSKRKISHEMSAPKRRKVSTDLAKPRASDDASPLRLIKAEEGEEVNTTRSEVEVDVSSPSPLLFTRSRANSSARPIQSSSYASPVTQSTMERKIISHFIDGHVLYESNMPFPVRNAMSIVRATLQSNGDAKSSDIAGVAAESTCINDNQKADIINKPTNGESSLAVAAATVSLSPPTASVTHQQHSVSLSSSSGHQKRQQVKSGVSDSRDAKDHKEEGVGNRAVKKKKRKKSLTVHSVPYVANGDAVIPVSTQNGHKGVSDICASPTNSELAVSTFVKMSKPIIPTTNCAASAPPPPPSTTATGAITSTSSSVSGGVGNDLKVKIHPVYRSGTCTSQSASTPPTPTATLCAKFSPSIFIPASISSSSLPAVSDSTSVVSSISASALRTHGTVVTKTSTIAMSAHATTVSSSREGNYALPRQLPPPLPRGPMKSWSPSAVADFVRGTPNCANYAAAFEENEIDGEALLLLTTTHFVEPPIGMKIGHALKFAHRIRKVLDPTPDPFYTIKGIDESISGATE